MAAGLVAYMHGDIGKILRRRIAEPAGTKMPHGVTV